MESTRPQFYPNTLQPSEISKANLETILQELQLAIKNSVTVIAKNCQPPTDASGYGNIYSGTPGIILTLLRLERQKQSIQQQADQDYFQIASDLIVQTTAEIELIDGRLSALASNVAPSFMRILAYCEQLNLRPEADLTPNPEDFRIFNQAVERATLHGPVYTFKGFSLGADELVFGRAGLLWSLLTLKRHASLTTQATEFLTTHISAALQSIPKLVDAIIAGGRQGAQDFIKLHGPKDALPLMWQWMEGYYALGAMHGATGILTMLLSCDLSDDQQQDIADTVTGLCRICIDKKGHFPMSIPDRPDALTRPSPFVQLCHGPPGLLVLLGAIYEKILFVERFWRPEWDTAIRLGTEKIWEEGLLSKGGNVCHGLTGNAWSLLSLHNVYEYYEESLQAAKAKRMAELGRSGLAINIEKETLETLDGDYFLSRALPFMLLARESPPYSNEIDIKTTFDFRAPDRPYSFAEGLAGQMSAWAETCAVIKARLRSMELESDHSFFDIDETFRESLSQQLGYFGLVVNGPKTS